MRKLLHERLRAFDAYTSGGFIQEIEARLGIQLGSDVTTRELLDRCAKAIADEIERGYIPFPRYADGTPVPWNGEYEADSGKTCKMTGITFHQNGMAIIGKNSKRAAIAKGAFVKRPIVLLDADDAEIKVGDAGWYTETGEKITVVGFCDSVTPVEVVGSDGGMFWIKPHVFTKRGPDSLGKLRADMDDSLLEWVDSGDFDLGQIKDWISRVDKFIEGEA